MRSCQTAILVERAHRVTVNHCLILSSILSVSVFNSDYFTFSNSEILNSDNSIISGSSLEVSHSHHLFVSSSHFSNNIVTLSPGEDGKSDMASAIQITSSNNASFLSSTISNNIKPQAGAVIITDSSVNFTDTTFFNNTISGNTTLELIGGAIKTKNSTLILLGCPFSNNSAPMGGAIGVVNSFLNLEICTLHANNARVGGNLKENNNEE